jgi:hypothetical protein
MNFKEMSYDDVNWVYPSEERKQWPSSVNIVINVLIVDFWDVILCVFVSSTLKMEAVCFFSERW